MNLTPSRFLIGAALVLHTCFSAVPATAETLISGLLRISPPPNAPRTLTEAIGRIMQPNLSVPTVRLNVIGKEGSNMGFVIPIAGNTPGSNGTYYRSDLTISNHRNLKQIIGMTFLTQGQNNMFVPPQYFDLDANATVTLTDVVGKTLQKSGLGAILVVGYTDSGSDDPFAELDGESRIWTPVPNGGGTTSQNFDGVMVNDLSASQTAHIMNLRQSSAFRTNVGIVNFDVNTHTWNVVALGTGISTPVTVPPYSVVQVPLAAGSASDPEGNVVLRVTIDAGGNWWTGYASSSDNTTGDGWISRAKSW